MKESFPKCAGRWSSLNTASNATYLDDNESYTLSFFSICIIFNFKLFHPINIISLFRNELYHILNPFILIRIFFSSSYLMYSANRNSSSSYINSFNYHSHNSPYLLPTFHIPFKIYPISLWCKSSRTEGLIVTSKLRGRGGWLIS